MTAVDDRKAWFSILRVVQRAWSTFRGLAVMSLGLVFVLSAVPDLLVALMPTDPYGPGYSLLNLPLALLGFYAQVTIIVAALRRQRGEKVTLRASLREAGSGYLPALGVGFLAGLGELLGLVLLVLPGLWLITVWSVAVPARLMRSPGATTALDDSRDLTRGVRWQVFALVLASVAVVMGSAFLLPVAFAQAPPSTYWVANFVLSPLINAASLLIFGFGSASLYHELRWGPGKGAEDETAQIFD